MISLSSRIGRTTNTVSRTAANRAHAESAPRSIRVGAALHLPLTPRSRTAQPQGLNPAGSLCSCRRPARISHSGSWMEAPRFCLPPFPDVIGASDVCDENATGKCC
eukprot:5969402-Prymnesium_polylepis.1